MSDKQPQELVPCPGEAVLEMLLVCVVVVDVEEDVIALPHPGIHAGGLIERVG